MHFFKLLNSTDTELTFEYPVFKTKTISIPKDDKGQALSGQALVDYLNNFSFEDSTEDIEMLKNITIDSDVYEKFQIDQTVPALKK